MITSHLSSSTQQNNHLQEQSRKRLLFFSADRPIKDPGPKAGLKKIPKPTIMEFDRQAAWSVCCTHNTYSRQFPTALPRSVSLDRAGLSNREPLDGRVILDWGRHTSNRTKGLELFIVLCYTFLKKQSEKPKLEV